MGEFAAVGEGDDNFEDPSTGNQRIELQRKLAAFESVVELVEVVVIAAIEQSLDLWAGQVGPLDFAAALAVVVEKDFVTADLVVSSFRIASYQRQFVEPQRMRSYDPELKPFESKLAQWGQPGALEAN